MSVKIAKFREPKMVKIIHQKSEKIMIIQMVRLPKDKSMMGEGDSKKVVVVNYEFELGKYTITFF